MDMFDQFLHEQPSLLVSLQQLDAAHSLSTVKRLQKETNKDNFLSAITELQFGLLFHSLGATLRYEYKAFPGSLMTPDWSLVLNGQTIVAEVARLNPAQDVQRSAGMVEALAGALKEIRIGCCVQVTYDDEELDPKTFDFALFKEIVENWLGRADDTMQPLTIDGIVTLHLVQRDPALSHVCFIGTFQRVSQRPDRLYGEKSILQAKIKKYGPMAAMHNVPLVICLGIHAETWFDEADVSSALYGSDAEFDADEEEFNGYYPGAKFHIFRDGLFYCDDNCKNNISGVLLRRQGAFTYYHNYFYRNRLSLVNEAIFSRHFTT